MYCKNCGKEIKEGEKFCSECGTGVEHYTVNNDNVEVVDEVENSGSNVEGNLNDSNDNSQYSNNSNAQDTSRVTVQTQAKSKIAAGLFGIFLGCFGVHNFYLGYTGKAVAQLLITLLSCFTLALVSGIWGFVEGILILTGQISTDAEGNQLGE